MGQRAKCELIFPSVWQDEPVDHSQVYQCRTPDFAWEKHEGEGYSIQLKVGKWETAGRKEIWHADLKKRLTVEYAHPHRGYDMFYVQSGRLELTVQHSYSSAEPQAGLWRATASSTSRPTTPTPSKCWRILPCIITVGNTTCKGQLPIYLTQDHHEGIVSRDTFNAAKAEFTRRRAILAAVNSAMSRKAVLVAQIESAMRTELAPIPGRSMSLTDIEQRLSELNCQFQELFNASREGGGYLRHADTFRQITEEMAALKTQKATLLEQQRNDSAASRRIQDAMNILNAGSADITEWDEDVIRQLVDTVKVLSADRVMVCLRGGMEIEQVLEDQEVPPVGYRMTYLRIISQGYVCGWQSDAAKAAFKEESHRLFQEAGWNLTAGKYGESDTVTKGPQDLYLHPTSFSGVLDEANVQPLRELLSKAQTFRCNAVESAADAGFLPHL